MNTSSFLTALRAHVSLPLLFRAGRQIVAPGYHLTEVKRVAYETMDCGAMLHRWNETQFELWVPEAEKGAAGRGHMPTEKFLRIVQRVEAELPLDREAPARIHAAFGEQPAALYDVAAVVAKDDGLWIELTADKTRCKAAERRLAAGTGSCCGRGTEESQKEEAEAGCGCGTKQADTSVVACCA